MIRTVCFLLYITLVIGCSSPQKKNDFEPTSFVVNDSVSNTESDTSKNSLSTFEDSLLAVVAAFPEVAYEMMLVDSLSKGHRNLSFMFEPNENDSTTSTVRVMEDNGETMATYFIYEYSTLTKEFTTLVGILERDSVPASFKRKAQ